MIRKIIDWIFWPKQYLQVIAQLREETRMKYEKMCREHQPQYKKLFNL